jgi:hypothetical protein
MIEVEMEIIPVISGSVILAASLIPLYFILMIRTKKQKILHHFYLSHC